MTSRQLYEDMMNVKTEKGQHEMCNVTLKGKMGLYFTHQELNGSWKDLNASLTVERMNILTQASGYIFWKPRWQQWCDVHLQEHLNVSPNVYLM